MARAILGKWEEAASDLHVASKIDHDEEISMVLKKVLYSPTPLELRRLSCWGIYV